MTRTLTPVAFLAIAVGATFAPARGAAEAPAKVYVVVFNFASQPARLGEQLADSIRLRLRRHKEYEVLDRLTTADASGPLSADADQKKIIAILKDKLGMHVGIYGSVSRGGGVTAEVCMIRLKDPKPVTWKKTFSDDSERARGILVGKIAEAVRSSGEWKPPEYGDASEPAKWGPAVNINGGFETGHKGWDAADNATTFIEPGPPGRGKVLRIRTDVERDKWLAYRRKLRFGQASPANPPTLRRDTSYGSVAGLEGVHYRSHWIKAAPHQRYWLVADMKGKSAGIFFPKIFVKGFMDWSARADGLPEASLIERKMTAAQFAALPKARREALVAADARQHPERYRRECFRWYLACRNEEDVWKHYAAPFPPRGGLPDNVGWLQIQVYAYWPPGEFRFNDVNMYKDPRQKAPLKVEGARTPHFGKTSDIIERLDEMVAALKALQAKRKAALAAGDAAKLKECNRELQKLQEQIDAFKKAYKRFQLKDTKW